MQYLKLFNNLFLIFLIGWYLITNLQWYNYKLDRVIFKHHKIEWHFIYFIIPVFLYYLLPQSYYLIYLVFHLIAFVYWNKHLDKPLVVTNRVKRFLFILFFFSFVINGLLFLKEGKTALFIPLILTYLISQVVEKIIFVSYKHKAKAKLAGIKDLKIITVTASFGKTSIKNFLYQILSSKYKVYKTPRSVNTIAGIIKDINENLPNETEIYITEAGAREKGDIEEITKVLNPQFVIIGQIGSQHIEYFKSIENIIQTKLELLNTTNLEYGLIHRSIPLSYYDKEKIEIFPNRLEVTRSDLNGIWFDLEIEKSKEHFFAPLLGKFNATNLASAILMAKKFGLSVDEIKLIINEIKPIEHRMQLIRTNGKMIIDDSFNGNFEGISEGINIVKTYNGRKVIVTPGLVESNEEQNFELAKKIDKVFDLIIITSKLNIDIFKSVIKKPIIEVYDKSVLTHALANNTKMGDLIYFANDAPNFI